MPWRLVGTLGSSILGGVFGSIAQNRANRTNIELAREANRTNYQIHKETQQYNTDMWNRNNAYNDPAAQRARYEAAGINPFIAHGAVDAGSATLTQSGDPAPMQAPHVAPSNPFSGVGSVFDALREDREARMFKYQERIAEAQAIQEEVNAKNAANRSGLELEDLKAGINMKISQTDYNIFKISKERKLLDYEIDSIKAKIENYVASTDKLYIDKLLTEKRVALADDERELMRYQMSQLMASARYLHASANLTTEQVKEVIFSAWDKHQQGRYKEMYNNYFSRVLDDLVGKASSEAVEAQANARKSVNEADMSDTDKKYHGYLKAVDAVDKTGKAAGSVVDALSGLYDLIMEPVERFMPFSKKGDDKKD